MEIKIVKGSGYGLTRIAAFDRALYDAGIANYNLICLSSVIPPESKIVVQDRVPKLNDSEYGHKLYVVLAESYCKEVDQEAWSGIGWVNHNDGSGKGLFVEHSANSKRKVIDLIKTTLKSMSEYRPEERGKIFYQTNGIKCNDNEQFACAIVAAVFKSEGWT